MKARAETAATRRLCYSAAMKTWLLIAALAPLPVVAADNTWVLDADSWARPRDGRSISAMAPLPEVVRQWSAQPGRRLLLRYPGGEEGQLWVYELRSWLVALGVPQESQELVAGSQRDDQIEIELSR